MHLFLIVVGLLWLVPTFGLFVTSLLSASSINDGGWWRVFTKPSLADGRELPQLFENDTITHSLITTLEIAVGGTVLPILIAALAGYAFAWLEFPGRTGSSSSSSGCSSCRSRWR